MEDMTKKIIAAVGVLALVAIAVRIAVPAAIDSLAGEAAADSRSYALRLRITLVVTERQSVMPNIGLDIHGNGRGSETVSLPTCRTDWHHRVCAYETDVLVRDGMESLHLEIIESPIYDTVWEQDIHIGRLRQWGPRRISLDRNVWSDMPATLTIEALGFRELDR